MMFTGQGVITMHYTIEKNIIIMFMYVAMLPMYVCMSTHKHGDAAKCKHDRE